jgi:hypothetical protein
VCCRDSESTEVCEILCRIPWAGDPTITKHRACSYVFFSYHGWGTLVGSNLIIRNREFCVWNSFDETLLLRYLVLRTVSASYDSFRYLTIFFGLSRYSDSLRAGRFGDRILVGARFPAPVQTGSGAQPASYTMGAGSFQGVKRPGRGVDHPPPLSAEVKERVEIASTPPLGLRGLL